MALKTKKHKQHVARTPKSKPSSSRQEIKQTFTHHIRELRRRLFLTVVVSIIVGSVVYYYHDFFIELVMRPLQGQKLVYLTPTGGFSFIFMVTFYATMLVVLPFLLYQIYAFIRPAVPEHTTKLSIKIGLAATLLMAAGATFGYLVAVPGGLDFLNNFAGDYVTATLTASSYLSFVLAYVLGIGVLFELPLLLLFWHWVHPLTPKGLLNSERFVIVGAFVAAAILSPSPDALSQTIIAVPIIIVYQLGVVAVLISIKKAQRQAKRRERIAHIKTDAPELVPELDLQLLLEPTPVPTLHAANGRRVRRRVSSMDGMMASPAAGQRHQRVKPQPKPMTYTVQPKPAPQVPPKAMVAQPVPPQSKPAAPRARPGLVVPRRTHVISDFGPVRRQIVDMGR